jgi:methanogenic corrinoid protein MtbC1
MGEMRHVVDLVRSSNLDVKVMVGGAPLTQAYCDQIGADCYTVDAASAADQALLYCRGA